MSVIVTNTNEFDHFDRFNGQDYAFPRGEDVPLDEEAAAHMFGLGRKDKTENLLRLGWADEQGVGVKKLAKFVFSRAELVKRAVNDAPEQPRAA